MTTPLAVSAARTCPHAPPCTLGEKLHVGSVVVDVKGDEHTIDHFRDYPGKFKGDTARRAYDAGETWRVTVGDHEMFHALPD